MKKPETEYLGVKIPKKLREEITDAVKRGEYINSSDLTRTALRLLLDTNSKEAAD